MAVTLASTEVAAPLGSFEQGNGVQRWSLTAATSGTDAVTVVAAVASHQIRFKGVISVSAACIIKFRSAAAGTVVATLYFVAKGSQIVKCASTKTGELLEIISDTDLATLDGNILTLPVGTGENPPPDWKLEQ
ncbi:hypothetical protein IMZ48_04985 [Candidatus Bathyarchaeota archaeon]|nr:hypothetical protein [Chloroflexota bacterium]MBE3041931.1 hypothetical protein [Candidatus Bathyarchaeota archaeon]MBE3118798.1 hypothetical protein [Candidatus Atribacteria bacterium]